MGQQHAKRNIAPSLVLSGKFGDDARKRRLQVKQPTVVQDHCHGSCCDHLGDGSEVENSVCRDRRRIGLVSKSAQRFERHQLP